MYVILDHGPHFFGCYGIIRDYSNSWDVPKLQHLDAKIRWMWRQPSERDSKFTPSHSDLTSKNRVLEHGPRFFVCYEDGLERCCAQNNPAVSVLRAKIHRRWRHLKKSVDQPEFGTQYVFCHSTESGFAAKSWFWAYIACSRLPVLVLIGSRSYWVFPPASWIHCVGRRTVRDFVPYSVTLNTYSSW